MANCPEGGGQSIYKTVSMRDHNFSNHPLSKGFFHAKMTLNKDFYVFFSQIDAPKQKFVQKSLFQNLTGFLQKSLFLENGCF